MGFYRNLLLASAMSLGACEKQEAAPVKNVQAEAQEAATAKNIVETHTELSGIQHLVSDVPKNEKKYVAVICGKPVDSQGTLTFAYLVDKCRMSLYHVMPDEPMAKKLGLQEGQTLLYKEGKEICRVDSTISQNIGYEPAYHEGFTDVPPKACKDALKAGKKAPDFSYKVFNSNETVSLKSLEGKVAILDFWATWCGPCLQLRPYLEELSEKYPEISIIGISVDQDAARLQQYLLKNPPKYTIVNDPLWSKSPTVMKYQIVGIPDVYLIDQKGIIRGRDIHYDLEKRAFTTEKLEAKIKELLKK